MSLYNCAMDDLPNEVLCAICDGVLMRDLATLMRTNWRLFEFIRAFYGAKLAWFRRILVVNKQLRETVTHIIFDISKDVSHDYMPYITINVSLLDTRHTIYMYSCARFGQSYVTLVYTYTYSRWKGVGRGGAYDYWSIFDNRVYGWLNNLCAYACAHHKFPNNAQLYRRIVSISNEKYTAHFKI